MTTRPTADFALEHTRALGVSTVRVAGRLVAGVGAEHPAWTQVPVGDGATQVVVDLRDVTAIDAGGLGGLLRLRHMLARRGARLTIEAASPRVARVLRLARLDAVLGIASGRGTQSPTWLPHDLAGPLCRCA